MRYPSPRLDLNPDTRDRQNRVTGKRILEGF